MPNEQEKVPSCENSQRQGYFEDSSNSYSSSKSKSQTNFVFFLKYLSASKPICGFEFAKIPCLQRLLKGPNLSLGTSSHRTMFECLSPQKF